VLQITLRGVLPVAVPLRLVGASNTVVRAGPALTVGAWFASTINALLRETTSVPVLTVTLRVPAAAAGSIFNTAVTLVAEFTVSEATVIPAPKLAFVVPWTKFVNCPVIATERFC
jgi:hypothetical protein